jgi:hypothetical protein
MKAHQLFGGLSPALAGEILEFAYTSDKPLYRTAVDAVAKLRKLRPVFLERQPRTERHASMATALSRPGLELAADGLIRNWLLKKNTTMLTDFLDSLKISHDKGVVEDLPPTIDEAALESAVEALLAKYSPEAVAVYLHAFHEMNESKWSNLAAHLETDPRLQFRKTAEVK